MKTLLLLFLIPLILSSCSATKPEIEKIPDISHVPDMMNTSAIYTAALMTGEISENIATPPLDSKPPIQKSDTSVSISLGEAPVSLTEEVIKKVATLDDLRSINPMVTHSSNIDHPKFVELQKDQMLLNFYVGKIQDPGYLQLQKDEVDIIQGKEIWNDDMKTVMNDFNKMLSLMNGEKIVVTEDIKNTLEKKNSSFNSFYSSQEYKWYLNRNQERINTIHESMKEYWTPEMLELQKNIMSLSKEVNEPSKIDGVQE